MSTTETEEAEVPLLIGSAEWKLQRFLLTRLSTRPYLDSLCLGYEAPTTPPEDDIAAVKQLPLRYQLAAKNCLSKASVAGVLDTTAGSKGKWLPVIDKEQKLQNENANISIISKETSVPEAAISVGNVANKALNVAGKFALAAAVVIDSYRVGKAVYEDIKEQETLGKRTAKTTASVASGWAGGFAGAAAGNSAGALIGGTIGAAFGGVGAIPGAAVGSLVGCLVGGVGGGITASIAAEKIVDTINSEDMRGEIYIINDQHIYIKPTVVPENETQEEEWIEIIKLVTTVALLSRQISIVCKQSMSEVLSYDTVNLAKDEYNYKLDNDENSDEIHYISKAEAEHSLILEICNTPHFFCSYLLLVCNTNDMNIELDLIQLAKHIPGEQNILPTIKNEVICMADSYALVWFNPQCGLEATLDIFRKHSPYLEVVDITAE